MRLLLPLYLYLVSPGTELQTYCSRYFMCWFCYAVILKLLEWQKCWLERASEGQLVQPTAWSWSITNATTGQPLLHLAKSPKPTVMEYPPPPWAICSHATPPSHEEVFPNGQPEHPEAEICPSTPLLHHLPPLRITVIFVIALQAAVVLFLECT